MTTDALTRAINNSNLVQIYLIEIIGGCPNNLNNKDSSVASLRDQKLKNLQEEIAKSI